MAEFDVEALWRLQRIGAPSLSPDGAQVVAAVTRYTMSENKGSTQLWLMSTLGGQPRQLTACGEKDGQPQWSPDGQQIAFIAKREQQGQKDDEAQLYLMAPDGGEARRAATIDTGVEAYRWVPRSQQLLAVSWVRPGLKGMKAQSKAHKEHKALKTTGYATSETQYRWWDHNLPQGREPHLLLISAASDGREARVRDLFEGLAYSLPRAEPDANSFDVSPDGKRVVFAFDPLPEKRVENVHALAELEISSGRVKVLVQEDGWHCSAPKYSPDGHSIAFLACNRGCKHTMPDHLAVWKRGTREGSAEWQVQSAAWDYNVEAPLQWSDDSHNIALMAEEKGRKHLWRWNLASASAQRVVEGGTLLGFDQRGNTLVTLADSVRHPGRLHAHHEGQPSLRIESFNDAELKGYTPARTEERWVTGALGEQVQLWVHYPPGFTSRRRWPVLHLIHGGPHTAFGDAFHFRWNVQAFAAAGYVVACVNYHGSSSFGHAFLDSITQRWGELELQDVEAASDWLLAQPWVDPKRLYATGGSYGGYMVAWMNGKVAPGRYAAYVCHAGCFDWVGMFADDAFSWHAQELGAWYWDDIAKVHRQSPHAHAAGMKTPTLVIHGALDYRVPDAQGLAYYNTLKVRGVDARLLWFPDENHWILKPQNSRQWYAEFLGWLEGHGGAAARRAKPRPKDSVKPLSRAR